MSDRKLLASKQAWGNYIDFALFEGKAVGKEIIMETLDDGDMCSPTFTLKHQEAQILMDSLWDAGLRPSEGSGSAGALRATEKHLNDMRKLVFKE